MHARGPKKVKLTFQGAAEPFRGIGHPAASVVNLFWHRPASPIAP
jgi:hypothetical protein